MRPVLKVPDRWVIPSTMGAFGKSGQEDRVSDHARGCDLGIIGHKPGLNDIERALLDNCGSCDLNDFRGGFTFDRPGGAACASVDGVRMARTFLTLRQLVVAVICPAFACGLFSPHGLDDCPLIGPQSSLTGTGSRCPDSLYVDRMPSRRHCPRQTSRGYLLRSFRRPVSCESGSPWRIGAEFSSGSTEEMYGPVPGQNPGAASRRAR